MHDPRIRHTTAAISYIEAHLSERLDLDTVAGAVGYSKYHLHRMFTDTAGITLHDYIRRRQLTEAAKRLVFSKSSIIDTALLAGFESQQAFTAAFKSMYKRTPLAYKQRGVFYPLQLELTLDEAPASLREVSYAEDLSGWMEFAALVIGGFPCLEKASHLEQVKAHIRRHQALLIRDEAKIIAAAAFSRRTGHIDFLAVHPQYRYCGADRALLDFMVRALPGNRALSITTFREGDKADTGQRRAYRELGFAESELLTEFGYPVQRLVLPPARGRSGRHGAE